ncbi:hypothetical protein AAVH_35905, partial [Aphelenchoides avenae]
MAELRMTIRYLIKSRRKECINCEATITLGVDVSFGKAPVVIVKKSWWYLDEDVIVLCQELLRWAVDELNEQRGQIHCLRSQLSELVAELNKECSSCCYASRNLHQSMPAHNEISAQIGGQGPPPAT